MQAHSVFQQSRSVSLSFCLSTVYACWSPHQTTDWRWRTITQTILLITISITCQLQRRVC